MEPVAPSAPRGECGSERTAQLSRTLWMHSQHTDPRAEGYLHRPAVPTGYIGQIQAFLAVCSHHRGLEQSKTSSTTNQRPRLRALGRQPCVAVTANGKQRPLNEIPDSINSVRDSGDSHCHSENLQKAQRTFPLGLRAWVSLGETQK